tara:strand:- start:67 stop:303 length:237 start_codon:yes stop_codon:yes gene_type:complete
MEFLFTVARECVSAILTLVDLSTVFLAIFDGVLGLAEFAFHTINLVLVGICVFGKSMGKVFVGIYTKDLNSSYAYIPT